MIPVELERLKGELAFLMQLVASYSADFDDGTWTFHGEGLKVSGGEYLVIHMRDWEEFWRKRLQDNG